jgi:hypothetical protein
MHFGRLCVRVGDNADSADTGDLPDRLFEVGE